VQLNLIAVLMPQQGKR